MILPTPINPDFELDWNFCADWICGTGIDEAEFQLKPGQIVTMTNGIFTNSYTIPNIFISSLDYENSIEYGTADPGVVVGTFLRLADNGCYRDVVADENGNWFADFSTPGTNEEEANTCDMKSSQGDVGVLMGDDNGYTYFFRFVQPPIENHSPIILSITSPTEPVALGTEVSTSLSFSDRDVNDIHKLEWNWGDGSSSIGSVDENLLIGYGSHIYEVPGVYTVSATILDSDALGDTKSSGYIVIYDPASGFITGGGWIESPPGAYKFDKLAQGKATFGFVSKYLKGAKTPSGSTEFQFKMGNLNFKALLMIGLSFRGPKASIKAQEQSMARGITHSSYPPLTTI
jgi:PKD repeat protein